LSDGVHRIDAAGHALLPGFIDLHTHGAMGHDTMDASPEGLREMAHFYARHGVTSFLATTWTASHESILASLSAAAQVVGQISGGATLLGVHLEGPYINPERPGAQDSRLIRLAGREEVLQVLESGVVRLVSLAPEISENLWVIDECARRGITVSAGHTHASYEQMKIAVAHGLRHVTHCFNAMDPLGHREPGTVGAAMALPEIRCELIADNVHIHPAVQNILVKVKGPQGVILVTDSVGVTGLPDGEYTWGAYTLRLQGGQVRLPGGQLAGSCLTLERALGNLCRNCGLPLGELWPASSLNAARQLGIDSYTGSLEPGKQADLVLLDADFQVRLTVAAGEIVFEEKTSV
jgi:N-acetylglucosamine-6-phosphate deacetylase